MTRPLTKQPTYPSTLDRIAAYPGVVTISGWQNLRVVPWVAQAVGPAVDEVFVAMDRSQDFPRYSWVHLIATSSHFRMQKRAQGSCA